MRLLLLPGNMCDARLWAPLGARLDAAGIGWSVGDLATQESIGAMAADMLAPHEGMLLPVGFSMGAIAAVEMARQAPERIAAMALLGFNATADLPERAVIRPRQQADVRAGRLAQVIADELKPHYLAAANRDNEALRTLTMAMAMELGPDVFVRQSEALRTRADLTPVLPTLKMPMLLGCGAEDRLCPPEWHARWRAMIGPRAQVRVFADAGHLLPLEQPDALADVLIGWLASIEETPWPTAS
jgi:pimeloyl-ACP methyl ester carboxylesterase